MYPILFSWGPFILPAWHTFYVLGAIAAFFFMIHINRKFSCGINPDSLSRLFVICYLAGYFGARILSIFIDEPDLDSIVDKILALGRFGAMTFYGGFIGALLFGTAYITAKKLRAATILDICLPSGLLALAVGRIGCFLNGDDFGKPVPLLQEAQAPWWAVTFPNLEDGIARYPVQLIATASVGILVFFLYRYFERLRTTWGDGSVAITSFLGYGILRFFNEFIRGDPRGWVIEGILSPSQLVSILIIFFSLLYILAKATSERDA